MLLNKSLDAIEAADFESLINVEEGRQIEFKGTLPSKTDDDIKEFLKDVSALANTVGGDIYYGVREGQNENGHTVATAVEGVSGVNADEELKRLDSLIRDCIKPRLVGYRIKPVHLANSNTVFIIRVPRSWSSPHVVDRAKHWRFYYRNSSGNHPMDVSEVRNAVLFSDHLSQRLEELRLERLPQIAAVDKLSRSGKIILHLQPIDSIHPETQVDISQARSLSNGVKLIGQGEYDPSVSYLFEMSRILTFDGLIVERENKPQDGYVQLFRNGVIEAVDTLLLNDKDHGIPCLNVTWLESYLNNAITSYLLWLKRIGSVSAVKIYFSLLDVKDYIVSRGDTQMMGFVPNLMEFHQFHQIAKLRPFTQNEYLFGVETLDNPDADVKPIIERWLDVIWNMAGFDRKNPFSFR